MESIPEQPLTAPAFEFIFFCAVTCDKAGKILRVTGLFASCQGCLSVAEITKVDVRILNNTCIHKFKNRIVVRFSFQWQRIYIFSLSY